MSGTTCQLMPPGCLGAHHAARPRHQQIVERVRAGICSATSTRGLLCR